MGEAVRTCFARYATFSGRASRAEFWWFFLFVQLGGLCSGIVDAIFFDIPEDGRSGGGTIFIDRDTPLGLTGLIFNLATVVPWIAVGWRRMHDTGRSGLYLVYPAMVILGIAIFAGAMVSIGAFDTDGAATGTVGNLALVALAGSGLVFLISPLLVLWWLTRPSEPRQNRYGPPPAR